MPYADPEKKRAYNRAWAKENPQTAATTPLCGEVERAIERLGPVGPTAILGAIGHSTTYATVAVTLARLRRGGRIKSLGYGQWVIADALTTKHGEAVLPKGSDL